jgi:predicted esterase
MKSSKQQTLGDFAMSEADFQSRIKEYNPIENLAGLAKLKVPMFSVHGDNDILVPYNDNTKLLQANYQAAGGTCDVKIIPGGGHEISPSFFECQELIDFVIKHAKP